MQDAAALRPRLDQIGAMLERARGARRTGPLHPRCDRPSAGAALHTRPVWSTRGRGVRSRARRPFSSCWRRSVRRVRLARGTHVPGSLQESAIRAGVKARIEIETAGAALPGNGRDETPAVVVLSRPTMRNVGLPQFSVRSMRSLGLVRAARPVLSTADASGVAARQVTGDAWDVGFRTPSAPCEQIRSEIAYPLPESTRQTAVTMMEKARCARLVTYERRTSSANGCRRSVHKPADGAGHEVISAV